jgi:isopenicillin-N epimerase
LIISWAWVNAQAFSLIHEMWGTRDISAFLSVPAAIQFQEKYNWPVVREECHERLVAARRRIIELSGEAAIAPEDEGWFAQMACMALPDSVDAQALSNRLFQNYQIEIPITIETGKKLLRISMQGYNTQNDLDRLIAALEKELT